MIYSYWLIQKEKTIDVQSINSSLRKGNDWIPIIGRLRSNNRISLINAYDTRDTIGSLIITNDKIVNTVRPMPPITMPIGNFDPYFSLRNQTVFVMDSVQRKFYTMHMKQFPDSIYTCLNEISLQNGGQFFGKNYSISYPSNGLTYITVLQEHSLESTLAMYIIDKENVLQNDYLPLAGGGGDEGDYWKGWGYFINDSTYISTSLDCQYESHCDSTITHFIIQSNGKYEADSKTAKWFRRPYN